MDSCGSSLSSVGGTRVVVVVVVVVAVLLIKRGKNQPISPGHCSI